MKYWTSRFMTADITQVIHKTFEPFLNNGQSLPSGLAPALLHRFSSQEGYHMDSQLVLAIESLKQSNPNRRFNEIVVGVITNSDNRVPDVLSSFGLDVSAFRYGKEVNAEHDLSRDFDIDFHCMSYDVGYEKPDRQIFDAADSMLAKILAAKINNSVVSNQLDSDTWTKMYVGDEYEKDVVGSQQAGWKPVLLTDDQSLPGMGSIESCRDNEIDEAFANHSALRVRTVQELVMWLVGV